jgi:hypothetical protein
MKTKLNIQIKLNKEHHRNAIKIIVAIRINDNQKNIQNPRQASQLKQTTQSIIITVNKAITEDIRKEVTRLMVCLVLYYLSSSSSS